MCSGGGHGSGSESKVVVITDASVAVSGAPEADQAPRRAYVIGIGAPGSVDSQLSCHLLLEGALHCSRSPPVAGFVIMRPRL